MPVRATLAIVLIWVSMLASAAGQDLTADVPVECGTSAAFRAQVHHLLGARAALLASGISVRLSAREEGGYRLRVALPQGERVLDESSCRELLAAAALIVASSVEQREPVAQPPVDPAGPPTQLAADLTEPVPPSASVARALTVPQPAAPAAVALPARSDRQRRRAPGGEAQRKEAEREVLADARALRVGVGAGLVWGVLPAVSAGFDALLGARLQRVEPTLALRYAAPRDIDVGAGSVRVQVLSTTLVLAYLPVSWLRIGLGGDAHALRARGRDLSGAARDWAFTFGPRLESWATLFEAERGSLLVGAAGLYQVRGARFASARGDVLHAASSWGFQAGVRGSWEFF